ncbi:MAG: quinone-dependent dihydroorotate dehydrogenase [Geminicoccaceae bacterium]|nr:quinone-dependent dihydroorotate dehydrogenase [Geminicoccaceae bacterium]MDW8368927.1 quinone-dependent dihydroorotate dehydrogenase [Geminicoccaceae bacterium]
MLAELLRPLPPERAHALALALARMAPPIPRRTRPRLATRLAGLALPHPVGLAAGFDKNAEAFAGLLRLGFAFVEVGTVTPRPQAGNPPPRLFRLVEDRALVNRMGFNNDGLEAVAARLARRDRAAGVVGANIGVNRDSDDPIADYVLGIERLAPLVDYLVVNVSSPNTPGLRDWQRPERLAPLLATLMRGLRERVGSGRRPPLFLKIAPDLENGQEATIVATALEAGIDGLVISNTTTARPESLRSPFKREVGGLSGDPLFAPSTELLRRVAARVRGRLALVGVGGIDSPERAYAKIRAGASAVQLYTGLVYEGPRLVRRILDGLERLLDRDRLERLEDAIGLDLRDRHD